MTREELLEAVVAAAPDVLTMLRFSEGQDQPVRKRDANQPGPVPTSDPTRDLNVMREVEFSRWREPEFMERYQAELQAAYAEAVGYQGENFWWMAGPMIRCVAFLRAN